MELRPARVNHIDFAAFNEFSAVSAAAVIAAASTAENIAVASDAQIVMLLATNDIWIKADATATVPSADASTGASIFVPGGIPRFIQCRGITNISVISEYAGTKVNALFWDQAVPS